MSAAPAPAEAPPRSPISNFRDAGGWMATGGRMVTGRLFRSAAPGAIAVAEARALRAHGVDLIIDLRGVAERAAAPTLFPDDDEAVDILSTPVEPRTSARVRALIDGGEATPERLRDLMIESYRAYVAEAAGSFGAALTAVVNTGRPTLVHCTAGKDRTGFVVAVLQAALGVSENDILADYLRTNTDWDRTSASRHLVIGDAAIAPMLAADADYLAAAFEEIARRDGSPADFIRRATAGTIEPRHLDAFIHAGDCP